MSVSVDSDERTYSTRKATYLYHYLDTCKCECLGVQTAVRNLSDLAVMVLGDSRKRAGTPGALFECSCWDTRMLDSMSFLTLR